jgi:hypothetical protein
MLGEICPATGIAQPVIVKPYVKVSWLRFKNIILFLREIVSFR